MLLICSFSAERSVQKLSSVLKEASITNMQDRWMLVSGGVAQSRF